MTKHWVKKLSTNVKGEKELELAPCTFVVGKNGDGKSGIIDAISLAITGAAASDGLGKKELELMRLAPDGSTELYASAIIDNGDVVKWRTEGSTEKAKKATHETVGELSPKCGVVAFDIASALLLGSHKALLKAMLKASGGTIEATTILGKVPSDLHAIVKSAFDEETPLEGELPVTTLLEAVEKLDKSKRDIGSTIKAIEKTSTGVEELQPLNEGEAALLHKLYDVFRHGTSRGDVEKLVGELKAEIEEASETTQGEVGADAMKTYRDRIDYIDALMTVCSLGAKFAEAAVAAGGAYADLPCPVCNRKPLEPGFFLESIKRVEPHRESAASICEALEVLDRNGRRFEACVKVLGNFDVALETYRSLRKRESAQKAGDVARGNLPELKQKIEETKSVLETLQKVAAEQVDRQSAVIERRLNRFLPSKLRAKIEVSSKKCSLQMRRGKEGSWYDFRALSGGEKATLIAAFASAILTEDAAPIRLLVIDDVWLDTQNMKAMLKSLATAVNGEGGITQAIVCAVEWGAKKVPDGWHPIRLDAKPKKQKGEDDDV
jgi:hypothetical protein